MPKERKKFENTAGLYNIVLFYGALF